MLLGFKRRFAPFVVDGSKTHTIRATRKNPPRAGEMCHCYVDPRQKTMRLFGRGPCVRVERFAIGRGTAEKNFWPVVYVDHHRLAFDECNALAYRDGFRSRGVEGAFAEMVEYWQDRLPFEGHIIHWKRQEGASL